MPTVQDTSTGLLLHALLSAIGLAESLKGGRSPGVPSHHPGKVAGIDRRDRRSCNDAGPHRRERRGPCEAPLAGTSSQPFFSRLCFAIAPDSLQLLKLPNHFACFLKT